MKGDCLNYYIICQPCIKSSSMVHTHTHTYTHTQLHTNTYTHTYTHTHNTGYEGLIHTLM